MADAVHVGHVRAQAAARLPAADRQRPFDKVDENRTIYFVTEQ